MKKEKWDENAMNEKMRDDELGKKINRGGNLRWKRRLARKEKWDRYEREMKKKMRNDDLSKKSEREGNMRWKRRRVIMTEENKVRERET